MIDTWLFAALLAGILSLIAVMRAVRAVSRDDRLVAGTVAVILMSATLLLLSIGLGMAVILDLTILAALAAFIVLVLAAKNPGAGEA